MILNKKDVRVEELLLPVEEHITMVRMAIDP
jgi:hypothetical protein